MMPGPFDDLIPGNEPAAQPPAANDSPIARLIKGEKQKASPLWDAAYSGRTGLRQGVEGLAGLPGTLEYGGRWLGRKGQEFLGYEPSEEPIDPLLPTGQEVGDFTSQYVGEHYQPQTTAGKYARTIGEFLPGAVAGPGGMVRNALTMGVAPAVVSETAGQMAEGSENEGLVRALTALGTGLTAGAVAGRAIPPTARQTQRANTVDAARRQDVHLPAAAMPDSPVTGWLAGKAGQIPFLGAPLRASADRTITQLGGRLDEVAGNQGMTNFGTATEQTRDLLNEWQGVTAPAQMTQRYDAVDNIINAQRMAGRTRTPAPAVTTPLSNTAQTYRDLVADMAEDTTVSMRPALDLVEDAIGRPGGLTYHGLKRLRTDIGARGPKGTILPQPGTSMTAMERLYGALTEDLRLSVYRSGGAPALRAWEAANDFTREIKARQGEIARIIGVKGNNSAENIANRMLNMAGSKSGGHLERLRTARRAVAEAGGAQAWDDIGAALIQRLGRDPSSPTNVFSPERFLTAMGKFEPESARVLFGRGAFDQLQDLRVISEAHRNLMRYGNPSGTGGVVTGMSIATGIATAPVPTLAVVGGGLTVSAILARRASREAMINWARARNGVLEARTPASVNALVTASNSLAPYVAMESGRDENGVANELAGGAPAAEPADPFADLVPEAAQ